MIVSLRSPIPAKAALAALFLLAALVCPTARSADKDKEKAGKRKRRKRSSPGSRFARPILSWPATAEKKRPAGFADEFESLLRVFQSTMPNSRVTTGVPVRILAARDGQSFARMAPEFPYDKRHDQPPGLFVSGLEKTYIAIRANAGGRFRYADIFQNYARQILKLSYRNLPPWIEEGYSTVYSSLTFSDRGARLERPDPDDLSVLFESPLLPLDLVLHVDRTSDYYSPGNKGSVYFAESRVLLHMLISDPQFAASSALDRYITAVQSGADSLQAARDAFGDLNQLQTKLDAYVKNVSGPPVDLSVSGGSDSGGAPRMLSAAASEGRTADFLALRGRSEDAEDKLNEALMSEPSLAEAEQSLGFILMKRDDLDEAEKHFGRAAQLDPADALNFYGQGLVAMAKGGKTGIPLGAAVPLEKAVALNSEFAAAWYNLAMIYSQHNETLQKALTDAQRAASLAPGEGSYQLQVAALLDQAGHPDEARKTPAPVKEPANNRAAANKAGDIIARASPAQPSAAPAALGNTPVKSSSDSGVRVERKAEPEAKPSSTMSVPATPKTEPAPAPVPPLFSESSQVYSMVGKIAEVNCASAPQIQITLKSQTILMKLHANDFAQLSVKPAGAASTTKTATCSSLRGLTARISYLFVTGKPWDAEMQTVEIRNPQE